MRQATALVLTGAATSTTTNGNSRTLFDAWFKLDQISQRIDDEFQKVVLNQAQQIANADPATFDTLTFVTGWTQQTQGYNSSTTALTSFRTELNKVFQRYVDQHSDELVQAAKEKRQALQAELDKHNEADTALENQIKTLDKFIGGSYKKEEPEAAAGQKTSRKKGGAKPSGQRAASIAAKKGVKKGAQK